MPLPQTRIEVVEAGYIFGGTANCAGCQALIEWWRTPKGKRMPIDRMPLDDSPFVPHFATCPKAQQFRKR